MLSGKEVNIQMIEKELWMKDIVAKLRQQFGSRLLFVGLQGSYQRNEATEASDFDVMVILDELSTNDLNEYRSIIKTMPEHEKTCGFVSGQIELANWPRYEIFQFKQDTKSYFGDLNRLLPDYDEADIRQSVKIAAANLYHATNHSYLFGDPEMRTESLKTLYKSAFFILQLVEYLHSGKYHHTKTALLEYLSGEEKSLMEINLEWEKYQNDILQNPNTYYDKLIVSCKRLLCKVDMTDNIYVRIITEHKKDFLPLLLLGDEQESYIEKYLKRGELFALYENGLETVCDLKAVCVVTDEGGGVLEIQNLATDERYRRQGYALKLVDHIAQYYKNRYDKIILGTGDVPGVLAFYKRCGFTVTHRVPDYFTTHYDHPMIEEGILLKDKVYLEMSLRTLED